MHTCTQTKPPPPQSKNQKENCVSLKFQAANQNRKCLVLMMSTIYFTGTSMDVTAVSHTKLTLFTTVPIYKIIMDWAPEMYICNTKLILKILNISGLLHATLTCNSISRSYVMQQTGEAYLQGRTQCWVLPLRWRVWGTLGWASSPGPAGWAQPSGWDRWCAVWVWTLPSPSLPRWKTFKFNNILTQIGHKFSFFLKLIWR